MGRAGGRARAQKHTKEQLSEWGRLGGRPKKADAGGKEKSHADPGCPHPLAADLALCAGPTELCVFDSVSQPEPRLSQDSG
jgi:hypothetical protein